MRNKYFVANVLINTILVGVLSIIAFFSIGGIKSQEVVGNEAVYSGNRDRKEVSLMFNVYWGTEYLEPILKILEQNNVQTTFFIGGCWAVKNVESLKLIKDKGHEIGNHGYSHKDAEKLSYEQNYDEICLTNKVIKEILGIDANLFAPPSGAMSGNMFKAAKDLKQTVIMWSRDTIDWRDKDVNIVTKRATSDIQNGDFILMHPTQHTLKALPRVLNNLKEQGFKITTVSACLQPSDL